MATTTFAEIMARFSASMLHAALANAAEKAAAQNGAGGGQPQAHAATLFPPLPLSPFIPLGNAASETPPLPCKKEQNSSRRSEEANAHAQPAKQQQKQLEKPRSAAGSEKASPNKNGNGGETKKRKKELSREEEESEKAVKIGQQKKCSPRLTASSDQQQQQQFPPSHSPLSSRISTPDDDASLSGGGGKQHKGRKLKLYAAEEKVDIIDYAKCIGNRAAGREFNVAESSIREWRKNEEKIRRQAETTAGCTQHFEKEHAEMIARIDNKLVKMIEEKAKECADWYGIGAKAAQLWAELVDGSGGQLGGSEMKVTMGWVSRFMRRNEQRVPKIAPPIIATGNTANASTSSSGGSPAFSGSTSSSAMSMVKSNVIPNGPSQRESKSKGKTTKRRAKGREEEGESPQPRKMPTAEPISSPPPPPPPSLHRRKCQKPMRVDAACATLLTSSSLPAKKASVDDKAKAALFGDDEI